jgi:CRISPR-associated protein Cas1
MAGLLPPLKPIAIKERLSILFIEKGHLDVLEGAFVVVDKTGVRVHVPVGGVACLMLEPGTRVSHAAVALAARVGTASMEPPHVGHVVFPTPVGMNRPVMRKTPLLL